MGIRDYMLLSLKCILAIIVSSAFLGPCLSSAPLTQPPLVLGGSYCITALPTCNLQAVTTLGMPGTPLKLAAPVQPTLRRLPAFDNFRFRRRKSF